MALPSVSLSEPTREGRGADTFTYLSEVPCHGFLRCWLPSRERAVTYNGFEDVCCFWSKNHAKKGRGASTRIHPSVVTYNGFEDIGSYWFLNH
jgi:hypothetical protein